MKRWGRILLSGIGLGIAMLVIQHALDVDSDVFLKWFIVIAVIVLLVVIIVNVSYHLVYMRRMQRLLPLLAAGDYDRYIEAMEALLRDAKGKSLRAALALNLSAGYIEAGRFDDGRRMLEGIPSDALGNENLQLVCAINLAIAYLRTGERKAAREVCTTHAALFQKYRNSKDYGGYIALLHALRAMGDGKREEARETLAEAQRIWQDPRLQHDYRELLERLEREDGEAPADKPTA